MGAFFKITQCRVLEAGGQGLSIIFDDPWPEFLSETYAPHIQQLATFQPRQT